MIKTKKDLLEYINADKRAYGRKKSPAFFGDELYKFVLILRKYEYYSNANDKYNIIKTIMRMFFKYKYHKYNIKLGISIPINVFGKGLCIVHPNGIFVSKYARVGENCRIQTGVVIGGTNGQDKAPQIGNNVYIGAGAKIIGNINIPDNVAIGANSVVVKDILESDCTYAGVPSKKVSNNSSLIHLKGYVDKIEKK